MYRYLPVGTGTESDREISVDIMSVDALIVNGEINLNHVQISSAQNF